MRRALFWVADKAAIDAVLKKPINKYRRELGLKEPVSRVMKDWWVSPQMVIGMFPPFFGPPQMDWDRHIKLTSFPLYDARGIETVSAELEEFLHAGEPPIVFTPGSANLHARDFFETARTSCMALKRRGLFLSPYAENKLENLPATIKHFSYAPLSQILSRCAAQVCHGGIGTVAQAISAGIPQIVMALGHDQYDNGTRVERLGIGHWRKARYFKSHWLTPALDDILTNPKVAAAVAECKAKLAGHEGIRETCDLLETLN
jgi:UDP:flavonoid glycosyltransferase YjiC (YdhE family)